MRLAAPAEAGIAVFDYHGQLCEVTYVLSPERPTEGAWDGLPIGGTTLWKTGGNGAELLLAHPTGFDETETVWACGDHLVAARFRLLPSAPFPGPGIVCVPLGRRWLEIVVGSPLPKIVAG